MVSGVAKITYGKKGLHFHYLCHMLLRYIESSRVINWQYMASAISYITIWLKMISHHSIILHQ